jgi:hypothetical protein
MFSDEKLLIYWYRQLTPAQQSALWVFIYTRDPTALSILLSIHVREYPYHLLQIASTIRTQQSAFIER